MNNTHFSPASVHPAKQDRTDEMILNPLHTTASNDKHYQFNSTTGETHMTTNDTLFLDEEDPFPTHRDEGTWIRDDDDGHDDYEENVFSADKIPLPWAKYIVPKEYMSLFPEALEAIKMESSNAVLTWEALSSCIAITIHNLDSAIRYSKKDLYYPYTLAAVNVVRLMLVTAGCTDKEQFHKSLQAPHRTLIAILARLRLSTLFLEKIRQNDLMRDWASVVDKQGLTTNVRDLLVALRTFVTACQAISIKLMRPDPGLESSPIIVATSSDSTNNMTSPITTIFEEGTQDDADQSHDPMTRRMHTKFSSATKSAFGRTNTSTSSSGTRILRANSTSTHLTSSTARSNSTTGTSIFSDTSTEGTNGDESDLSLIRTHGHNLQRSIDSMLGLLDNFEWENQQQLTALVGLLFTRLDHLSSRTSQLILAIESIYIEKEAEMQMSISKQALLDGFGRIFCNLQLATGEHTDFQTLMPKIRDAIQSTKKPIASILDCVESIAAALQEEEEEKEDDLEGDNVPAVMTEPEDNSNTGTSDCTATAPSKSSNERWYMGHDYTEETLQMTGDGNVKSGTLAALVERLTPHDQLDMNFIRTFLLTYRSFCMARQLFELLVARFNQPVPDGLTAAEFEDWRERKQKVIQLRVFNVFKMWIEYYFSTEEDQNLLDDVLQFIHATPDFFAKNQLERVIQQLQNDSDNPVRKMVSMPRDAPEPMLPRNMTKFRLLDIPPLELARQMAIMNFDLYRSIKPSECLHKGWSGADDGSQSSPNVRKTIDYNNRVTLWVCGSILSSRDAKKRSEIVKYWIQVSEKCNELNNFNTCMAILSAFDSSSIGRLRRTWDGIGQRHLSSLACLRSLFSPNRNFIEYRTHVHSVNPPCIPFLGIYLQDLTFIEDGNPNVINNQGHQVHINFSKLDKIGRVIRELQQFQNVAYSLQSVAPLQTFITAQLQSNRDEERIYRDSLAIEPKEREDQMVTRMLEESGFV
ncbi:ras guanine nucleotide exchange factor domain-containing protein [Dichotomocladium elegans]|nr:ras guanine nucleotide exchange factor domain-containing protein [Dichotomocladium elegans]